MGAEVLGIGLCGKSLTDLERSILRDMPPYAIVLFGRNIESASQLRDLVAEVKSLSPKPPIFTIDEEGGRVDRLRHIVPGLPSAEAFAEGERPAEMSEWFGRLIGMALRWFDIECNLAPVVDVRREAAPKGLERRTFGADAKSVIELAGAFTRGMQQQGVAACLKHFPGIGAGSADPHYGATVIDVPPDELRRIDLEPYVSLGNLAEAVMIGHGTYPQYDDPDLPATFSHRMTTELLRNELGFRGLAMSDDMEMHAVSDLGTYEEIAERALLAGNDVILYCSHVERVPDIMRFIDRRVRENEQVAARFREASARAEAYRAHCEAIRAASAPPASMDAVLDEAVRFDEEFRRTRPPREVIVPDSERRKNSRSPGSGRSGREEWT